MDWSLLKMSKKDIKSKIMDRKIFMHIKEKYPKLGVGRLRFGAHYRGEKVVPWGIWYGNKLLMSSSETRELMGDEFIEELEAKYKEWKNKKINGRITK